MQFYEMRPKNMQIEMSVFNLSSFKFILVYGSFTNTLLMGNDFDGSFPFTRLLHGKVVVQDK